MNIHVVPSSGGAMTPYQQFIHLSRYARWIEDQKRRETHAETINRYLNFFRGHLLQECNFALEADHINMAFTRIFDMDVMPSMRCMMMAGAALERENMAGYNCAAVAIDHPRAFDELLYILMCGSGVGFSVERQFVGQMPMIPRALRESSTVIVVEDSREGWASAFQKLVDHLYKGFIPQWDVSKVRPAGSRLKTTGGYASGPAPLVELFKFTVDTFKGATGRRLNSLECHDICCMIGKIVVVGGVRRAALISLSNPSDMRMRHAKGGNWYSTTPWRALANNSAAYTERPTVGSFMAEWLALYDSKSGERGIVNRVAMTRKAESVGRRVFWDEAVKEPIDPIDFIVNPCAEIVLRSGQTCNLTEVVARSHDTVETLLDKVYVAAMLGTWQSTLLNFNHVRDVWKNNCAEERLLGVSITGIMDCPLLNKVSNNTIELLRLLRQHARIANREWSEMLDIPHSAAVTTIKPSGTVSALVGSSSGIHARFAPYYVRRVINGNHDPITTVLKNQGVQHEASVYNADSMSVFSFPMASPEGAVFERDRSALEVLDHYKMFYQHWSDHNVSITVSLDESEWIGAGAWTWENFDLLGGVSFLPRSGAVYQQMPFEALTKTQYEDLRAKTPNSLDWSQLWELEREDTTTVHHELACTAGGCELV